MKAITVTASVAALAAWAGSAHAQAPSGLSDLVGARAAGGETQMRARGYRLVKSEKSDDRSYGYWWNASRNQCVSVATMEGRYDSLTATPAADCNQRENRQGSRDRGGYRPNAGASYEYGGNASVQRQSPSYVENRGGEQYQVAGQDVELGLVCFGDGQRPGVATTYGYSWNSRTKRYDYGNRTEMTAQQFDASLMLQLWSGGGHIRLPKKMVPPINTRGNDGWWDLYDVEMALTSSGRSTGGTAATSRRSPSIVAAARSASRGSILMGSEGPAI